MSEPEPKNRRSGQMIIFATLTLTVLFSLLGLSADLGYSYYVQLQAQAAADAAAKGAAMYAKNNGYVCTTYVACNSSYTCPTTLTSASNALQAGCLYASSNGFGGSNQTVKMLANNTALAGGASPSLWIQATTSQTVSHLFLLLAGFGSGPVGAKAIGGVNASPNADCIYVLDTSSKQDALIVSGGAVLTASSCGVYVDSSNSKALETSGGGSITATTIQVHGNYNGTGFSPTPVAGAATVSDPFSSMPAPTVSSTCGTAATTYGNSFSGTISPSTDFSGNTVNGPYCGGLDFTGSAVVTLSSGIYIVNGGGFTVEHGAIVTGSNVMIFLTGQHGQTNGPMTIEGNANVTMSAPSGGTYQGILFYQDRTATYTSQNTVSGSAVMNATGTFYFPGTQMVVSGSGLSSGVVAFVVKDLTISGSATLQQDRTGTSTGLAARSAVMLQ